KTFRKVPSDRPLRLAFLGCGWAARIHSKYLKGRSDVALYYASRSAEKAARFRQEFGGAGAFGSYEAAINDPEVDAVFVVTPPDSHLELTLQALDAGKHVLVEKPPFLRSADFERIREKQQQSHTQVLVAENYFYKPLLRKLRRIIASGIIGDIKFLFINATKTQRTGDWRDDPSQAGGGALFEGGIHWVNFISNLGLTLHTVQGFQPGQGTDMERSIQIVAKYREGPIATLLYSWEVSALLKGLRLSRIYGTRGSITFESNGVFIFARGKGLRLSFPGLRDIGGYKAMFADFLDALHKGTEPAFNLELAQRDLEVIERVYQSIRSEKR
ncbi:MAG: gfo/Idh/MocA family oxidoreductase, partial [Bacteroidetes bacterium]